MPARIVVAGGTNVDLIMKMERLPKRGEAVLDAEFAQTFGGKGANQAIAAALAGGNTAFITCLGDDAYAPALRDSLARAGVQVEHVFQERGTPTGCALIMIDGRGDNYLSVAAGANYSLAYSHIDAARAAIEGAGILVAQCEIRGEVLAYAVDLAHRAGVPVLLNLAPPRALSAKTLAKISILVVNETEAEFLCGFPASGEDRVRQAAYALQSMGPRTVILTLGALGAYVLSAENQAFVPAFLVQAVDTTGAGDVFCGCLAAALMEGRPILDCVRFASAAAAISTTRLGAQVSIPNRLEIEQFLAQRSGQASES